MWHRQLTRYPNTGRRLFYLAITVLATIVLYFELYVQGAVATTVIHEFKFSFVGFVIVLVVGNAIGAFASLFAGLADRWGRANLVVWGLLLTGLLVLIGLPHAPNKPTYLVMFALVSLVEGVVLVATPALIRDFSPQVGRGFAMGFWTLGPVLGSLVVTEVSSNTLNANGSNWREQFYIAGATGLLIFVIALFGLRELSPGIRDQLMVTMNDRALIEARAAGLDKEAALHGHWRQMLRPRIVLPAFSISIFLLAYYILVAFVVVYFLTVFGSPSNPSNLHNFYTEKRANALANWYWITNAIVLVVAGLLSDKLLVRKPFMIVGAALSMTGLGLFAVSATAEPTPSYYTFAWYFILAAAGGGMAYVAWMASFTETIERYNPAATATGLAVWGWVLRIVVTISFAVLPAVVPATSRLVDTQNKHPQAVATLSALDKQTSGALQRNTFDPKALPQALFEVSQCGTSCGLKKVSPAQATAIEQATRRQLANNNLQTASAIDPKTLDALSKNDLTKLPTAVSEVSKAFKIPAAAATQRIIGLTKGKADLALVQPYATALTNASSIPDVDKLIKATHNNPKQWQHWWWVCFAGQALFLPFIFLLTGRWSPRKARRDAEEHERMVQEELAALHRAQPATPGAGAPG
jgi:MFS family permease